VIGLGTTQQLLEHGIIMQMLEFQDTLCNDGWRPCSGEVHDLEEPQPNENREWIMQALDSKSENIVLISHMMQRSHRLQHATRSVTPRISFKSTEKAKKSERKKSIMALG